MKGLAKKIIIAAIAAILLATCVIGTDTFAKGRKSVHNVTYIYGMNSVTVQVSHGANAPVPTDTYVPGYQFSGWVGNYNNVTEDRVILGAYAQNIPVQQMQTVQQYTERWGNAKSAPWPSWWSTINLPKGVPGKTCAVHWYNEWNGEIWKTDIVPYGSSLATPPNPCIAGYDFSGWEGDWTNVTEDRAIGATYYVKHKLKFIDGLTGDTIDTVYVHDGEGAYPDPPHHSKKHFKGYFYEEGGEYDGNGCHQDHTFYARYEDRKDD